MSNQFYMYWHPGLLWPDEIPNGCEYCEDGEWHTDVGDPNIVWLDHTRRWPVPEHVYRAHKFCEAYGIPIPDGYEVIAFRKPQQGEIVLSRCGEAYTEGGIHSWDNRYPILHKIEPTVTYRTPTDEDALRRPTVEVRDYDREEWRERTLVAVASSECGSPFIATSESGCATSWHQCRMEVTKWAQP